MNPFSLIVGHEQVLRVFGRWPSFHDGEVHRLLLDSTRRDTGGRRYSSIELELRGWSMSALPSEDGLFKVVSEAVVGFLFEQVYDLALDGLNHQNVLSCLGLSAVPDPLNPAAVHLAVELEHCFGLSGGFKAAQASVLFVKPIKRADMA